ncbi:hypothetical protein QTP70_025104 [Hemibagrus guttatus]|uniref:Programmed cell death protein 5 n=1 Tax=Hemibagrus guttatus TaxID=175788 RepID=A0AAE0RBI7_9TELE|nr:hypothetical protein QTP70_025104 [Hemibagrus guttatus]KAK3570969.1 hypothetical protein QTP86_031228 [Hemibagrus guttatus]
MSTRLQHIKDHILAANQCSEMSVLPPSPLTTHVLNTGQGVPAAGMCITLYFLDLATSSWNHLTAGTTNSDGRCPGLITREAFVPGTYKMRFETGQYWEGLGETCFYPYVEKMADEELEAIRRQRMAELQAKHGNSSGDQGPEAKQRETEMRNTILAQVLDQSARARLSNLALVKPDKAKAVENYLIQMAQFGQLGGKISESGLIDILEKVSQQTEKKTTVKFFCEESTRFPPSAFYNTRSALFQFNRLRVMDSDEDDDY